jgi:UPF0176 protein
MLTASFYCFADLPDCAQWVEPLRERCESLGVRGNVLLAHEGINGSLGGPRDAVLSVIEWLRAEPRLAGLMLRTAPCEAMPFYRLKVRCKAEIVTMGVPGIAPAEQAGHYVAPNDWNALISRPDVVVIDVRNDYEVGIGSFAGAVDPGTHAFTDWPAWVEAQSAPGGLLEGKPTVAMFCTGGIRCEKASALLRARGFDEVHHLQGGILAYLETVAPQQSLWHGECFVFDERVAVGHGLTPGSHALCRSCRMPLSPEDQASPLYIEGVQCAHCAGTRTEAQQQALQERQRQMALAAARGTAHVGARVA